MSPRLRTAAAAGGLAFTGVAAFAIGPGAPLIVERLLDGREVWRLGRLSLQGVSGGALWDLRVARAELADGAGVWVRVEDLRLRWRPLALLGGRFSAKALTAARIAIARRPDLTPPRPAGDGIGVEIEALRVNELALAEGVAGDAAAFALEARLDYDGDALAALMVDLRRRDAGADSLVLRYARTPFALAGALDGPAGGAFAALLGAPLRLTVSGAPGAITASGEAGGRAALTADLRWDAAAFTLNAQADLATLPAFADIDERLGGLLRVRSSGTLARGRPERFSASLESPHLQADGEGALGEGLRLDGPMRMQAEIAAAALGLAEGSIGFSGALRQRRDGISADGDARAAGLALAGLTIDADGPLTADWGPKGLQFALQAKAQKISGPDTAVRLVTDSTVEVAGDARRDGAGLRLDRISLRGPAVDVSGRAALAAGAWTASGNWRVKRLAAIAPVFAGAAQGGWRLNRASPQAAFALALEGRGEAVSGLGEPLDALIGPRPALSAALSVTPRAVRLSRATIAGPGARLAAAGALAPGPLDLRLEASARGPFVVAGTRIEGVVDAEGALRGRPEAPTLTLRAAAPKLSLADAAIEAVDVDLTLQSAFSPTAAGRIRASGVFAGRAITAESALALMDGAATFDDLVASVGRLSLRGQAAVTGDGAQGELSIDGPIAELLPGWRGALSGRVALAPGSGGGRVDAAFTATDAGIGALELSMARISATGPIAALEGDFALAGAAAEGGEFSLAGAAKASLDGDGATLSAEARGALADAPLETLSPMILRVSEAGVAFAGAARLDLGRLEIAANLTRQGLDAAASLTDAPLQPLLALIGEPGEGIASGALALSGKGERLEGEGELRVTRARLSRRAESALDMTLQARLLDNRLTGLVEAQSEDGLVARLSGDVGVEARAAPLRIARASAAEPRLSWRLEGPIDDLWRAVGPLDQSLTGTVRGGGEARFVAGRLSGEGEIALEAGRFEDKITGLRLEQLAIVAGIDDSGLNVTRFSASDGGGGVVSGSGRIEGRDRGEIALRLTDFQLFDRPDARGRDDGALTIAWGPRGIAVGGEITLREARFTPPQAESAVALIDVVEVNAPIARSPPGPAGPPPAPVRLDVAVSAPGRVFTRGRGLEAEWAVEARIRGGLDAPEVTGEARLVRGAFDLAGRRFELTRGTIVFDGDPLDARLDIEAERAAQDLTALMRIGGTARAPEIGFSSIPALPEDEVLPQILFGRSAQALSALEAASLAAGLAELAGRSAFDVAGLARDLVTLDRLDVREQDGGLLLTGGKYLTRDVYVEVSRGPLGAASTSVEWRLRPRLYLISSFLPEGDQRVALRWRKDY